MNRTATPALAEAPSISPEAGSEAEAREALEAELAQGKLRLLHFAPPVERAYERSHRASRSLRIAACNLLGALAFTASTRNDASLLPHVAWLLEPLGMATKIFIVAAACLILRLRRSTPSWLVDIVTALGTVLIMGYIVIVAHNPQEDVSVVIRTGGMFLVFLHAGLTARQPLRYSLGLSVLGLLGYVLAARSQNELQAVIVAGNIRLFVTTIAFTLVANYVLEYRERRAYLLRALDQHRRRALTQTAEALQRLSLSDPLTGLANRRHFDAALRNAWDTAAERAEPLAVLQLDVDLFKRYNDRYGHPAGDTCLQRVAEMLSLLARQHGGLAARTGGEEFALLLPQRSLDAALSIGEAVRTAVRALALSHADSEVASCVTMSIGVAAAAPAIGGSTRELMSSADSALYEAKREGRDRVVCSSAWAATAPSSIPMAMPSSRPIPPADAESTPEPQTVLLAERIETITTALHHRLYWLRFPPALEAAYASTGSRRRALLLLLLGLVGMLYTCVYVWISRPLLADVADSVVRGVLVFGVLLIPVMIVMQRPMAGWLRESLFSALTAGLCIVVVFMLAHSHNIAIYSYSLSLYLVAMFSAIVAAQPFRFSLVTSLGIWGVVLVVLQPANSAWRLVWIESSALLLLGMVFSLIGGYLIELSARRDYLLNQLAKAQSALLTENAAKLRLLAESDPLTGLANRRKFDAEHAALRQGCSASGEPMALLIIDIDHFKHYNDRYGHPKGDACLRRVAQSLSEALDDAAPVAPGGHLVARIGGEEFGVLMPGCDGPQAMQLAKALCAHVRQLRIAHLDSPVAAHVTVSIGVASTDPAHGHAPATTLLSDADAALYRAKAQGRDQAVDGSAARD